MNCSFFKNLAVCLFLLAASKCVFAGQQSNDEPVVSGPPSNDDRLLSASVGYELGPGFRGTRPTATDQSTLIDAEYSHLGFSGGVLEHLAVDAQSSQTEIFGSYSYPLRWVDLSTGMQTLLNEHTGQRDSFEFMLEARAQPIPGLDAYLGQFLDPTHGFHSYTELKLSHRINWIPRRLALDPYALLGVGNYFSSSFGLNHCQFGIDGEVAISERVSIGLYGALVVPLDGVRRKTDSSTPEGLVGCRVTWHF